MSAKNGSAISRREFARRAAFVSAAASLSPAELLTRESVAAVIPPLQAPTTSGPKLSPEGQAALDRLRAFPTDNSDGPALYLKPLMEREKKPAAPATGKAAGAPKKS